MAETQAPKSVTLVDPAAEGVGVKGGGGSSQRPDHTVTEGRVVPSTRRQGPDRRKDNIYLLVYDNVIDANDPLNSLLVSGREEVGLGEAVSCGRVGVGAAGESEDERVGEQPVQRQANQERHSQERTGQEQIDRKLDERELPSKRRGQHDRRDQDGERERQFSALKAAAMQLGDSRPDDGGEGGDGESRVSDAAKKERTEEIAEQREQITRRRQQIAKRHADLLRRMLRYEKDLKMQEERRLQESAAIERAGATLDFSDEEEEDAPKARLDSDSSRVPGSQDVTGAPPRAAGSRLGEAGEEREREVRRLREQSRHTREEIARSKAKVKTFTAYKDHVLAAVALWPGETAGSVEQLAARFREVLVLRYELMCKVQDALRDLEDARCRHLQEERLDREREGAALLSLYRDRAQGQEGARQLQQAEGAAAQLQAASARTSGQLAQLLSALTNMYSIARHYQRSLPPLPPPGQSQRNFQSNTMSAKRDPATKDGQEQQQEGVSGSHASRLLLALHHFLQDATTTVAMAEQGERPHSTRPTLGSV